jgi:N6-L-threonylcarbamoyladenine synthase
MRILALESSCDESAAAFLEIQGGQLKRLEHLVASQAIHAQYGGVVPEVAAREHSATIPPLLAELAKRVVGESAGPKLAKQVDAVAVTRGPGLVTSLKVGFDAARALALAWDKPFYGINHMEGHIYANWLPGGALADDWGDNSDRFPALVLIVSGGHTELLLMKGHGQYELLGATRDDAAGEAFDKTAKLLGLGYPGGPALSKRAERGNASAFGFPRPLISSPNHDFSFAGLKTAVRYFLRDNQKKLTGARFVQDVAASVQEAIVDTLVTKTVRAAVKSKVRTVMLAGGVAANRELRQRLAEALAAKTEAELLVPPLKYCMDNAAMIAAAAFFNQKRRRPDSPSRQAVDSNWELGR